MQIKECEIEYMNAVYVPYNTGELMDLVGKVVKINATGDCSLITHAHYDDGFVKCVLGNGEMKSAVSLFMDCTRPNGAPIGNLRDRMTAPRGLAGPVPSKE